MNLVKFFLIITTLLLSFAVNMTVAIAQDQIPKEKRVEKHDDDDDDKYESPEMQKKLAKKAKISQEEAQRIALAKVPGEVLESELDKERGRLVYEFEIRDADNKVFDVLVDAKTGEIVGVEEDEDDDQEDAEDGGADTARVKQKKNGHWYDFWRKIPGLGS